METLPVSSELLCSGNMTSTAATIATINGINHIFIAGIVIMMTVYPCLWGELSSFLLDGPADSLLEIDKS